MPIILRCAVWLLAHLFQFYRWGNANMRVKRSLLEISLVMSCRFGIKLVSIYLWLYLAAHHKANLNNWSHSLWKFSTHFPNNDAFWTKSPDMCHLLNQFFIGNLMTTGVILFYVPMNRKQTVSLPLPYYKGSFLIFYVLGQRYRNKLWALEVHPSISKNRKIILVDIFISLEFGNPQQSMWFSDLCVKRQRSQNVRHLRN